MSGVDDTLPLADGRASTEPWWSKHLLAALALAPVAFATLRMITFSRGDLALLGTLAQSISVPATVLGSVFPLASVVVFTTTALLIMNPHIRPGFRRFVERTPYMTLAIGPLVVLLVLGFSPLSILGWGSVYLVIAVVYRLVMRLIERRRRSENWPDASIVFAVVVLQFAFLSDDLVPIEHVTTTDGDNVAAYVLGDDGNWATLVTVDDRSVRRIESDEIVGREVCGDPSDLGAVARFFEAEGQPSC